MTEQTQPKPLTALDLDEIAVRAAGLYEYATGLDDAWQAEADQLTGTDVPALIDELRRQQAHITELEEQRERRRIRLVALQNDALNMRGSLSPNGEDRKVPFPLGEALTPAVDWLIARVAELEAELAELRQELDAMQARVAELEGPAVEARAALGALCYDLEDPGSNTLGALYLLSQATVGVQAPRDDAAQALGRHDAQVMRRCAEFVRDTYSGEWADDAAATLERDADITERGCPGFEKEYQGVSDAKRRLANCKHCGKPRTAAVHDQAGEGR